MMEFNGSFNSVLTDEAGDLVVSFTVGRADGHAAKECIEQMRAWASVGKNQLDIRLQPKSKRRSLSANAYFHLLTNRIAEKMNLGNDEVKHRLVLEYGTVMTDSEGAKVGVKLPVSVDVSRIYPYAKWFDRRVENGKLFNCYIIYKQTHTLDSAEMARLIDGAVHEAQELGIETLKPDELSRMISLMEHENKRLK